MSFHKNFAWPAASILTLGFASLTVKFILDLGSAADSQILLTPAATERQLPASFYFYSPTQAKSFNATFLGYSYQIGFFLYTQRSLNPVPENDYGDNFLVASNTPQTIAIPIMPLNGQPQSQTAQKIVASFQGNPSFAARQKTNSIMNSALPISGSQHTR